ncbi:hypothetical protein JCM5350_007390 [Sporobolomyces pararoseus]
MSLLVLSAGDVSRVTREIPASAFLAMLGSTMNAVTKQRDEPGTIPSIQNPQRIGTESKSHKTLYMPSRLTTSDQSSATSIKIVAAPNPDCSVPGLPATTLLMNEETGRTDSIVNASELTGIRTAAASALATTFLANPHSKNLVVFGSGTQAYYHARLILELFPTITTTHFVVRKSSSRSRDLLERTVSEFPNVDFSLVCSENVDVSTVVRSADIICTCVPSTEPLFSEKDLKLGVHINAIGSYTPSMFEFPPSLISSQPSPPPSSDPKIPTILVDSRQACLHEAGELIKAGVEPEDLIEIGELCDSNGNLKRDEETRSNCKRLRQSPGERSLFKCVGVGAMDVAITKLVVEEARKLNLGQTVEF